MKRKRLVLVVLGAGAVVGLGLARRSRAKKGDAVDRSSDGPAGGDSLKVVEIETEDVDDDGNLVIDDLLVAVDTEGHIVATDETIAVITPEGDAVIDETVSVVGDDGALHAVGEDISVVEVDDE